MVSKSTMWRRRAYAYAVNFMLDVVPIILGAVAAVTLVLLVSEVYAFDDYCYAWEEGYVDGYCSNATYQATCYVTVPVCYGFNLFRSESQAYQIGYRDGDRRWQELH